MFAREGLVGENMQRLKVAILFGGQSVEHEISIVSAKNVVAALQKTSHELFLIYIDTQGRWHQLQDGADLLAAQPNKPLALSKLASIPLALVPGASDGMLMPLAELSSPFCVDVVFPLLHGTLGEDGAVQGLLAMLDLPCVGANVLSSALCMSKVYAKQLLEKNNISVAKWLALYQQENHAHNFAEIEKYLGLPFFVKPNACGSSVGVSKVHNPSEYDAALSLAFSYDDCVLLEQAIVGRELECAVLGNENPCASGIGELKVKHEFYSYAAKYLDPQGAEIVIPANLPEEIVKEIQNIAIKSYKTLGCLGMARVDFFLTENGEVVVNELNTIPGFTNISMYPKLWQQAGVDETELIDKLLRFAILHHQQQRQLDRKWSES